MRPLLAAFLFIICAVSPARGQVLTLTQVPACGAGPVGSANDLNVLGTVSGISDAAGWNVAAYVFTDTWWTKPTFAAPTAPLVPAGPGAATFSIDVTSHPNDLEAGYIAIFLVPAGITPPVASGLTDLPASLFAYPYVTAVRDCDRRAIAWKGRGWQVKDSGNSKWGPGPNYFTNAQTNVWVDGQDDLHLRIDKVTNRWYSAEIIDRSADPGISTPGYGTYTFQVASRIDDLDANAVLGLFTWDDDAASDACAHREIDFEAARWGNPGDPTNAQFVVQPYDALDHLVRVTLPPGVLATTHRFTWQPGRVDWTSWRGNSAAPASPSDVIASYTYEGADVPPAGGTEHIHLNLWLVNGSAPQSGQPVEVVVHDVSFTPLGVSAARPPDPFHPVSDVRLAAAPNPTLGPVTLTLSSEIDAPMSLAVVDLQGRLVRPLGTAGPGDARFTWDGRDQAGRPVSPGMYYAVASGGGVSAVRSVLVMR